MIILSNSAFAFIADPAMHQSQAMDPYIDHQTSFSEDSKTEDGYYSAVIFEFSTKSYKDAIDEIRNLRKNFPFSRYTEKMYQMEMFMLFLRDEFDQMELLSDQFYVKFPRSDNLAYMVYMKALALKNIPKDYKRQKGVTEDSLKFMNYILSVYPDTIYAKSAEGLKKDLTESLSQNEIMIGDFYFRQQEYNSALSRYTSFIANKENTNEELKVHAKRRISEIKSIFVKN